MLPPHFFPRFLFRADVHRLINDSRQELEFVEEGRAVFQGWREADLILEFSDCGCLGS